MQRDVFSAMQEAGAREKLVAIRVPPTDTRAKMYEALRDLERERDDALTEVEALHAERARLREAVEGMRWTHDGPGFEPSHDVRCPGDCGPCGGSGGVEANRCLHCGGSGRCQGCGFGEGHAAGRRSMVDAVLALLNDGEGER